MHLFTRFHHLWQSISPDKQRRLLLLFVFLLFLNATVWITTLLTVRLYPALLGLVLLAYGLGLRHAVDADHIAAIDNTTRKLMNDGKKPLAVGLFFSLGHATIVIVLSFLLALSGGFIKHQMPSFQAAGSIIGTAVSSFFLLLIGMINLLIFIDLIKLWRKSKKDKIHDEARMHEHLHNRGLLNRIFHPVVKSVTQSWQMYFIGLLFGLGFDTASEIALLGISAFTGQSGMPVLLIMLLPLAFTAGMALIDSLDGVLMLGAYGWAYLNPRRKLYYNLNITLISVVIALLIGGIEAGQLLSKTFHWQGAFFQMLQTVDLGSFGYISIATCIIIWLFSFLLYKSFNKQV